LNAYERGSINHVILTNLLVQGYIFEEIEDLLERELIDEDFERLLGITSFEPNDLYTHITQLFDNGETIEDVREFIINHQDDEDDEDDLPHIEAMEIGAPEQGGKRRKTRKTRKTRKPRKTRKTRKTRKPRKTRRRKQRKH